MKNNKVSIIYGDDNLDYISVNKKYETGIPSERV